MDQEVKPLVFDASVVVALAMEEIVVVDLLERLEGRPIPPLGIISAVNWCEVLYSVRRLMGERSAVQASHLLRQSGLMVVDTDADLATYAADVKHRFGLGLGDCFAAGLALATDAPLLTSDRDFLPLREHGLQVEWLGDPALQ